MPLYEYQCDTCGHRFEVIQRFSDPPVDSCQHCGGAVRKLLSSPAIQFKGSGWYVTDYARAGKSDTAPAGSSAPAGDSAPGASGDKKADSKTEAKTETTKSDAKPAAS